MSSAGSYRPTAAGKPGSAESAKSDARKAIRFCCIPRSFVRLISTVTLGVPAAFAAPAPALRSAEISCSERQPFRTRQPGASLRLALKSALRCRAAPRAPGRQGGSKTRRLDFANWDSNAVLSHLCQIFAAADKRRAGATSGILPTLFFPPRGVRTSGFFWRA